MPTRPATGKHKRHKGQSPLARRVASLRPAPAAFARKHGAASGAVVGVLLTGALVSASTGTKFASTTESPGSATALGSSSQPPVVDVSLPKDVSRDLARYHAQQRASRFNARQPLPATMSPGVARGTERGSPLEPPEPPEPTDPRDIARLMMAEYGWDEGEFECLDALYYSESQWDPYATNPYSGAYGIPQALPPEKMASAGSDWETNPETQIAWGLSYIAARYGTPCSAWDFKQANNWY